MVRRFISSSERACCLYTSSSISLFLVLDKVFYPEFRLYETAFTDIIIL